MRDVDELSFVSLGCTFVILSALMMRSPSCNSISPNSVSFASTADSTQQ
jgi:hypothetical protein